VKKKKKKKKRKKKEKGESERAGEKTGKAVPCGGPVWDRMRWGVPGGPHPISLWGSVPPGEKGNPRLACDQAEMNLAPRSGCGVWGFFWFSRISFVLPH